MGEDERLGDRRKEAASSYAVQDLERDAPRTAWSRML
jgi:hypothetical protein